MILVNVTVIEHWLVDRASCEEQVLVGNHYLLTTCAAATSSSSCRVVITLTGRMFLEAVTLK